MSTTPTVTSEPQPEDDVRQSPVEKEEENVELFPNVSSWFSSGSSWLATAKDKTMKTIDMVKKDLSEFSEVMSTEVNDLTTAAKGGLDNTVNVVKQQAQYLEKLVTPDEEERSIPEETEEGEKAPENDSVAEIMSKVEKSTSMGFGWMKSIVGQVTDTVKKLAVEDTAQGENEFTENIMPRVVRNTKLTLEQLQEIQSNEGVYLNEPENTEAFVAWSERFSIPEHDGEISILLTNSPALRETYAKLVPASVKADVFWARYFFAVEMAELDKEMDSTFVLKELTIKTGHKSEKPDEKNDSPQSDDSLAVVEQPTSPEKSDDWSVCSEKNEVEEVNSGASQEDEHEAGPLTPRASDEKQEGETKEDGWVNWDE